MQKTIPAELPELKGIILVYVKLLPYSLHCLTAF